MPFVILQKERKQLCPEDLSENSVTKSDAGDSF